MATTPQSLSKRAYILPPIPVTRCSSNATVQKYEKGLYRQCVMETLTAKALKIFTRQILWLWKEESKTLLYNWGVLAACIVCHCISDVFKFLLDKCKLIHRKSEITAHSVRQAIQWAVSRTAATVLDEGQRRLPENLRGLLQHIRNVWEHRKKYKKIICPLPRSL